MRDAWKAARFLAARPGEPARLLSRRTVVTSPHAAVCAFTPMEGHEASVWAWWWRDGLGEEHHACVDPRSNGDQFTIVPQLRARVRGWFEGAVAAGSWPQLVVASGEDADFVGALSRWLMAMPDPAAAEAGRYLGWFVDRSAVAGQSSLVVLDEVYGREWVRAEEGEWGDWMRPPRPTPASTALDAGFDDRIEELLAGADGLREMGGPRWSFKTVQAEALLIPWVSARGGLASEWWDQYLAEPLPEAPAAKWWRENERDEARRWKEAIDRDREYIVSHPDYTTWNGSTRPRTLGRRPSWQDPPERLAMRMMHHEAYASLAESRRTWEDEYGRLSAAVRGSAVVGELRAGVITSRQPTLRARAGDELYLFDPETLSTAVAGEDRTPVVARVERSVVGDTATEIEVTTSVPWEGDGWWLPAPVTPESVSETLYRTRSQYRAALQPRIHTEAAPPPPPLADEPRLEMLARLRRGS